jgi:CRP-like cAMP-binding protein
MDSRSSVQRTSLNNSQRAAVFPGLEVWQKVPYLEHLPTATLQALAGRSRRIECSTGQVIFLESEPASGLFVVEEGVIKVCRFSKDGREHILHTFHPGDTFNDVAALDGGANPATAIAVVDSIVRCVSRTDLQQLAHDHADLAWALLESIARRTRYLVGVVQDLAMRNVRGRLARLLLEQAKSHESGQLTHLMTQEEMANHLGTVREVLGRALRGLSSDGIIELDRHRIIILDRERLESEAEI